MDESKLTFWTGANYMKRLLGDSETVTVASFANQTITVNHNLGHIPGEFMVAMDIGNDDTLWVNNPYYSEFDTPGYPTFNAWTDENQLTILVDNQSGASATVTVYWVIYMDYA